MDRADALGGVGVTSPSLLRPFSSPGVGLFLCLHAYTWPLLRLGILPILRAHLAQPPGFTERGAKLGRQQGCVIISEPQRPG